MPLQARDFNNTVNANTISDINGDFEFNLSNGYYARIIPQVYFLKMDATQLRNGVLIFIAVESKKFAILGDIGINAKVEKGFWDEISTELKAFFKDNKFGFATFFACSVG